MKNTFLVLCFLLFTLFNSLISAQENPSKRGKVDSKKWRVELDKAKKGNTASLLFVVGLYRGDMLASNKSKDYNKALKWLSKFSEVQGSTATKRNRDLFLIKATGGFGTKAKIAEAKEHLKNYCEAKQEKLIYQDKSDLALCEFFEISPSDTENKLLLGRYYLEFGLSYDIGFFWLNAASNEGDDDAKYLKAKWSFLKSSHKQKFDADTLLDLSLEYAEEGSQMATMEHLLATNSTPRMLDRIEAQKYLKPSLNSDNEELKFKAKLLFLDFQKEKEYIVALREIATLQDKIDNKGYKLAKKAAYELQKIDIQIANIQGLHAFGKEQKFESVNFDLAAYQNSFKGNYKNLIALYHKTSSAENTPFIGKENLQKYRLEIQEKITDIVEKQGNIQDLLLSFEAISSSENTNLFPQKINDIYKEQINRKIKQIIESTQDISVAFARYEQSIKNKKLVDKSELEKYDAILRSKINIILNSFDAKQITYLSKAFQYHPKTNHILANYEAMIEQKLIDTGVETGKIKYFEFNYDIEHLEFRNFKKGEKLYKLFTQAESLSEEQSYELSQKIRRKVINTIYGNNPKKELVLKTKDEFFAQTWLGNIGKDLIINKLISYQELEIEETVFENLPQGENMQAQIINENAFDAVQKNQLLAKLRIKVIEDIYNKSPLEQKILDDKKLVISTSWLAPEGRMLFLTYLIQYFEDEVNTQTFTSIAQAERVFLEMKENSFLSPSEKKVMLSSIRKKALNDLYQGVPSPQEFIEIKAILDSVTWLKPEGYDIYSSYLARSLFSNIEAKNFGDLAQAHVFYETIMNNGNLSENDKKLLAAKLSRKAVENIYGLEPNPERVEEYLHDLDSNDWLNPTGKEIYFEFINDSKNSFSATLESPDKSKNYYYKVKIMEGEEDKYMLEIKNIKGGNIRLVYSSILKVNLISDTQYEVKIFLTQLKGGFKWKILNKEYIQINYHQNQAGVETEATSKMKEYSSKNSFGYTEQELKVKENTVFSEKEAIRVALKYFIFSYAALFD